MNIVTHYWEKEFKNTPPDFSSNCALVQWDPADPCADAFSVVLGYFPTIYDLRDNFEKSFHVGLRARKVDLNATDRLPEDLSELVTPIALTKSELLRERPPWSSDGFFLSSDDSFDDLINFWNLRASGCRINYVSAKHFTRFKENLGFEVSRLDGIPSKSPNFDDTITIYFRGDFEAAKTLLLPFKGKRDFIFSACSDTSWNGLNIKPTNVYFEWQRAMGIVEERLDRPIIEVELPEKHFLNRDEHREIGSQNLVVSVSPIGEHQYFERTIQPPFLRELNEFYSREIVFDPWMLRVEQDGIGLIIGANESSLTLYPLLHSRLIERIFELAGYTTSTSQAGLLTRQIILSMREEMPLEACRVFKITGVRKLLNSPATRNGNPISKKEATKLIWQSGFERFGDLFIESRTKKKLGANDVFSFLIRKKVFSPKAKLRWRTTRTKKDFKCRKCGLREPVRISDFEGKWLCPNCSNEQYMPALIPDEFQDSADQYFTFRRSGFFRKDNNQEGAIPVILSLMTFARVLDMYSMKYSTSLKLLSDKEREVDFVILNYKRRDQIQIGIAECKSEGGRITQDQIDGLREIQDKIKGLGIDCFIIFSKAADRYTEEELALFKKCDEEERKYIILSNKELEPYHPYWDLKAPDKLPERYVGELNDMYRNSRYLYVEGNFSSQ